MTVFYTEFKSTEDHDHLQQDFNPLEEQNKQWQMILNSAKCVTLNCTQSLSPFLATYSINNIPLQLVEQHIAT